MNIMLLTAGILLLGVTALDFGYTTISANRSGPLTRRTAAGLWAAFRILGRAPGSNPVVRLAGPLVMSGVAIMWIVLTAVGWLLIFRSHPQSLVMTSSTDPAGWLDTMAFVGSAFSTVGASNARPASSLWDNVSMVTAINGMVVLTLSVTFVLNITQTVAAGRGFSALIRDRDPAGEEGGQLLPDLSNLVARLNASPLALYYSTLRQDRSLPESLLWLAKRVVARPSEFPRYRYVLLDLPYLEADENSDPDDFVKAMESWTRQFSLSPQ
ncbi:MAG: hypothetical protein KDJ90_01760 [Nitratireductor sp.]|nr:hypothetical protein [Nitratireductor sp.]